MLWPLTVVLFANTNGRLAIPALAGLLVLIEQASSQYNKIGTHLVSSRCKTTSSVAILLILPNIALAAR